MRGSLVRIRLEAQKSQTIKSGSFICLHSTPDSFVIFETIDVYFGFMSMYEVFLLLIDSLLFLLIWLVQIIIYPSFLYMDKSKLLIWHKSYTQRITVFVLPLMFSQVALHGYDLFLSFDAVKILSISSILIAWAITFLKEVPLHGKIGAGDGLLNSIPKLIWWNWPRTIAWTAVFLISAFSYITL